MTHRGPFQPLLFCDSVNTQGYPTAWRGAAVRTASSAPAFQPSAGSAGGDQGSIPATDAMFFPSFMLCLLQLFCSFALIL